jgi:hypothetical protein
VNVAAGAGPTPLHVEGHAYLSGPYKDAPLSLAIITPAVAGPFDLGAVLVRSALYVDPESARIHAVSDPLPQIIEGIPLDIRSIDLRMARPEFTRNPISCDPMAIDAKASSPFGALATLRSPFQVGGCPQFPFKPKLSLKLKGGTKRASHPKLIATLKAKPGEANIAVAQVKLPPSAFLDQAHIRTICTRVQFAADACPKGSIYGTATAITPLLDDPISGNVYLRSSNHKLPDLVVALKGPASLPIEIDLSARPTRSKALFETPSKPSPTPPYRSSTSSSSEASEGSSSTPATSALTPIRPKSTSTGRTARCSTLRRWSRAIARARDARGAASPTDIAVSTPVSAASSRPTTARRWLISRRAHDA